MATLCDKPSKKIEGEEGELRILLIGKTGDGKSATGNTILGSKVFLSTKTPNSVTEVCSYATRERFGRKIVVVDTPGLCSTNVSEGVILKELTRSYGFSYPGFHAIIYVLASSRFTEECRQIKDLFFQWFGEGVEKHAMMILTNFSEDDGDPAEFCGKKKELKDFLASCGNRIVGIDNRGPETEKEVLVQRIISVVDEIVEENGNSFHTSENLRAFKQKLNIEASSNVEEIREKFKDSAFVDSLQRLARAIYNTIKEHRVLVLSMVSMAAAVLMRK